MSPFYRAFLGINFVTVLFATMYELQARTSGGKTPEIGKQNDDETLSLFFVLTTRRPFGSLAVAFRVNILKLI